jgi:hypothetical protein
MADEMTRNSPDDRAFDAARVRRAGQANGAKSDHRRCDKCVSHSNSPFVPALTAAARLGSAAAVEFFGQGVWAFASSAAFEPPLRQADGGPGNPSSKRAMPTTWVIV